MKTTYIKQRIKAKRKELHQLENALNNNTPCLTELGVSIGHLFFYKGCFWIRTGRYTAYTPNKGACSFNDISDPEFANIKSEAITFDQTTIHNLLITNLKELQ